LCVFLALAAIIDQTGAHALTDHADSMYAPYGKKPSAGVLYGLVCSVAIVDAVLWLVVVRVARSHRRPAMALSVIVSAVCAGLAVLLLVSSECGERIFPPLWGVLAMLPAVAGVLAATLLLRRDSRG
jgi:hypothetical protein